MPATIRLSASLKAMLGGMDVFEITPGKTVRDALVDLKIKPELVAMVSVNEEMSTKDHVIQEGEMIRILAVVGGG